MKHQSKKGILFRSEDIRILIQEESCPENRSHVIEGNSGFNLLFFLSSNIHLNAHDCGTQLSFKKNQYILHYSPEENNADLRTENKESLEYLHIQLDYQYIFNLINPESNRESADILEGMVKNNYIFLHKGTPPDMTVEMHMILREIIGYSKKGVMQKLFIEAKVIKLLMLIFEQFDQKNIIEEAPQAPTAIKKFIDENYHKNIRAEEIGKLMGFNQNKIRKDFKACYHMTVTDYISELRMLKAKKLITDKKMMIKEIAIECGYEYVQNFTRAFKKKYGVSPEKLRTEKIKNHLIN